MKSQSSLHRLASTAAPVGGVGVVVFGVAAWVAGAEGATVAACSIVAALVIAAFAEAAGALLGLKQPLERMLFSMLLRGGMSAVAITAAILAGGVPPKLMVLVALPIYLGLVLGEAITAIGTGSTAIGTGNTTVGAAANTGVSGSDALSLEGRV